MAWNLRKILKKVFFMVCREGKGMLFAGLDFQLVPIDALAFDARRRTGFEAYQFYPGVQQRF